eukprot:TRINITY_DN9578_c0_g2_i8.p1 TRINITY_DN9578_c0_g2~~TRINITY_DN9578_c0_g2_i8.p1  ORF type:complete len:232 (-),score=104.27 TRINITY_DN9578_c0_g2_i8:197-892(-)
MDIELELIHGDAKGEQEIVQNVEVELTGGEGLILESLISQLKLKGYFLDGAAIAYYSPHHSIYVSCATDPISRSLVIPVEDYRGASCLVVRARLSSVGCESANVQSEDLEGREKKRPKERKISYVINKVMEWRKLYAGMIDNNGQIIKYSLEEAADKVGISKKSLDDYMLQLRLGKKYGFDFQKNRDHKVGILRAFIKSRRKDKTDAEGNEAENEESKKAEVKQNSGKRKK